MSTESLLARLLAASDGFALIGAWARNAWAPPRATTDLDLVVRADAKTLADLATVLEHESYRAVRRQRVAASDALPDIEIYRAEDEDLCQVDLLIAKTAFEVQALDRALSVELHELRLPVVTPEDLVVYKLLANRGRDQDDVRAVVRTQLRAGRTLDWDHIVKWSSYWGIEERAAALQRELTRGA